MAPRRDQCRHVGVGPADVRGARRLLEDLGLVVGAAKAAFSDTKDGEVSCTLELGMEAGMENPAVPPLKKPRGSGSRPDWAKPRAPKRPPRIRR